MTLDKHILVLPDGAKLVGYCTPEFSEELTEQMYTYGKYSLCQVVINPKTNEVLKCRIGLEKLFDLLLTNKEEI